MVASTETALGFPCVTDFMVYFPVYIYRDTFTNCREYILKRFNTRNFEEAFQKFYTGYISPVTIILSYAWYFERDRYDWNLKLCSNLAEYNKRFPPGHTIGPEHIKEPLAEPQTAFHGHPLNRMSPLIQGSYCLSHEVAGNESLKCADHSVALRNNLVFFNHDIQRFNHPAPPCPGNSTFTCLQILERHYNQVGLEIRQNGRRMDWRDVEIVEKLAKETEVKCDPI